MNPNRNDQINDLHAAYYQTPMPVPGQSPGTTREKHKDATFIKLLSLARAIVREQQQQRKGEE